MSGCFQQERTSALESAGRGLLSGMARTSSVEEHPECIFGPAATAEAGDACSALLG